MIFSTRAIALFPGGHGKPQLRPFPFTAHREYPVCLLAGKQHSRAGSDDEANSVDATSGTDTFHHVSVLAEEITELFEPVASREGSVVVDATLGAGGHSERSIQRAYAFCDHSPP